MKKVSLCIDLVFCLVVLPVMAMIFPIERWYHNFPAYVISVGMWLYFIYFVNRAVTVPFLFRRRPYPAAGAAIALASVAVTYCFAGVVLYTPRPNVLDIGINRLWPNIQQYQQAVWSLFVIVETFSFALGLLTQVSLQRARRREVEAERDKARIALYKTQIKPHFMFNTLNSLYGLFLTRDDNALPSLEKFISMMRYLNTSSMRDLVPIGEEADYLRQYVELQSLRLNGMTTVKLDIAIDNENMPVPPMLFVTFVENCFKHGVSPVEKSTIEISLHQHYGRISFFTRNHIFPVRYSGENLGIANCRQRLQLLYPGRHILETTSQGCIFRVSLEIQQSHTHCHDKMHSDR